jgi:NADH-quinone oxidoreductase subunit K
MMATVPLDHSLLLAAVLFALGLIGVLARRNLLFLLMSIEIMLNAAGLAFVAAGARWGQPDGQIMFLFILTMAAAEVAVGLALTLQLYHHFHTLDVDEASHLRG